MSKKKESVEGTTLAEYSFCVMIDAINFCPQGL